MDRWVGKVAVVSGASSGIGAAIAKDLAKSGMIVIGLARRAEIIDQLWHTLKSENPEITGTIHSFKCDISLDIDVKAAFQWIDEKFGRVDVMINNAAVFIQGNLVDADNSMKLLDTINTNVFGVAICTREAFQLMQKHQINDGHVIIINSGAGHSVPSAFTEIGSMNMYSPSKYAARAMTEVLRQEFQLLKTKIKITVIERSFRLPFVNLIFYL